MKTKLIAILFLIFLKTNLLKAQDSIYRVIMNPDLKIDFPVKPFHSNLKDIEKYEASFNNYFYTITSEPFPISYKGKTIKDAEAEFYPNFTAKLIKDKKVKSLIEKDTTFEGHKVKQLSFIEMKPNENEVFVFMEAIMVSGFEEALYIITITSSQNSTLNNQIYPTFINTIDLYYKLENKLKPNHEKENIQILKKEGFIIEK
jgi:hypothetical protein